MPPCAWRAADKAVPFTWDGAYLCVNPGAVEPSTPIDLEYELPLRESVETMPVSQRQYRLWWRGDEVVACNPTVEILSSSLGVTREWSGERD